MERETDGEAVKASQSSVIILLDLNATLSDNYRQVFASGRSMEDKIRHVEVYRRWLVDWLVDQKVRVFLFTVRSIKYRQVTLERIALTMGGWLAERAYFNNTRISGAAAHLAKDKLIEPILEEFDSDLIYGFESNDRTRSHVYGRRGIRCRKISTPEDLPNNVEQLFDG